MAEAIQERRRRSMWVPEDLEESIDLYRKGKGPGGKDQDFQAALMDLARLGLRAHIGGGGVAQGGAGGAGGEIRCLREDLATHEKLLVLLVGALGEDAAIDMTFGQRMATRARMTATKTDRNGGDDGSA